MSSNTGLGGVLTTIVYLAVVGDQMTSSSSEDVRISWKNGHVSSINRHRNLIPIKNIVD